MAIKALDTSKSMSVSRKTDTAKGRAGLAQQQSTSGAELSSLMQSPVSQAIQAKLQIGACHNVHEQEADRVADNVVKLNQTRANAPSGNASTESVPTTPASVTPISVQTKSLESESQEETEPEPSVGFMELAPSAPPDDIQRQTDSSGEATASDHFESTLNSSKGGGSPLPSSTREEMESGIGADFSGVRIHTDGQAADMSQSIQAKAFTHGSDIYFNQGQYSPDSSGGKHLLAHELTHTVQQGAAVQTKRQATPSGNISRVQPKVQRGWLGDAWDSVSGAVSGAVEWAADQLDRALDWAKEKFASFVQKIPGYKLLSVVLGQDPVSGADVPRNGRNFIAAGLDIIPFGSAYQRKLEESGAMEEAALWLDKQIAKLDVSLSAILSSFSRFWRSLSVGDLSDIGAVLNRAANIIRGPVSRIINFAKSVASKLLEIVKKFVLIPLANFVKDNTRGYPLLRVLLGKDPISGEKVVRNGMNLITGFMLLSESGEEQLRQMRESGALAKAAAWIDSAVARLNITWEVIKQMFSSAWDLISITSLLNPISTFRQLANIFLPPVGRIIRFVFEVSVKVLQLIKDALISRLVVYARKVRGYPLLTVLLGKDPFSQNPVLRTTANIIKGFMSLIAGGLAQYEQMKQTGVIARLSSRVEKAIARLNITWSFIRGLFVKAWHSFSLQDLAAPLQAFARVVEIFAAPIGRILRFIWEILKIVIEVLLMMMSFPIDLIGKIISRAMQAINDIKRDPIGFIKNLMRAVKQGFIQFFDNIGKHLLNGLTGWLMHELSDAGIRPPADFTLQSVLGFVLDVLGITVEKIWQKLAERIGQDKVAKIRGAIDKLTGIWTFVRDVMTRGPIAIWEYIKEKISNLWSVVMSAIRNWIVTRIIQKVTTKLLSMLDPTGIMAVINGFIAFYNAVQSFIQYLRQMLEIVARFVSGVAQIAKGNVSQAANFLEGALARGIPIAIGFLANQVGLSGLGKRIGEMIESVRKMVDKALTWLVDKAVNMGTGFLNMLKSGVGAVKQGISSMREWWKKRKAFKTKDGVQHHLYYEGTELTVHSKKAHGVHAFLNRYPANKPGDAKEAKKAMTLLNRRMNKMSEIHNQKGKGISIQQSEIAALTPKIEEARKALTDELAKMDIDGELDVLQTELDFSAPAANQKQAIGAPITQIPDANYVGSSTGGRPILTAAVAERKARGLSSLVAQGHLISHRLHGPAIAANLAMIPTGVNTSSMGSVEKDAQKLKSAGKPFFYGIKVEMHPTNPARPGDEHFVKHIHKLGPKPIAQTDLVTDSATNKQVVDKTKMGSFSSLVSNIKVPTKGNPAVVKGAITRVKNKLVAATNKAQRSAAIKTAVKTLKLQSFSNDAIATRFNLEGIVHPNGNVQWTKNMRLIRDPKH